ncbi:MAG TPA: YcxB family protein [Micromonosporaceae bacterium]|jgi:hypothetical protein
MPTLKPPVIDQRPSRTFRRGTTMAWAVIMTIVIVGTVVLLSDGLAGEGFLRVVAPIFGALPLMAFVVYACFWPKVQVDDDRLIVQNAFVRFRIPYPDIKELVEARMGLIIMLHSGTRVPVTAYVSGSSGKMVGHPKMLAALTSAIEDRMAATATSTDKDAKTERTVLTANIVVSVVVTLLAIGVVWAAIAS